MRLFPNVFLGIRLQDIQSSQGNIREENIRDVRNRNTGFL